MKVMIDMKADAIQVTKETSLQKRHTRALVKANPGLGEKSYMIAEEMVAIGLKSTEALMLIGAVYSPSDLEGKGQATRLKHFSKALQERYGPSQLVNARQSPDSFRYFLGQIKEAVDMRDEINEELARDASITFHNTLLLQELGLSTDIFLGYVNELTCHYGLDKLKAVYKILNASKKIRKGPLGNLESLIFSETPEEVAKREAERPEESEN